MALLEGIIPKFNQVGIAVRDVDKTAKFMEEAFGIKIHSLQMPQAEAELRGRRVTYTAKLGLAHIGTMDFEFMEILEGEHLVKEFLEKHGPGLHHLGVYVDDLDTAVQKWTAAGKSVIQRNRHPSGIGTAFLDTEQELGNIYIELIKF
jgi:catechol 2,3-dioxygenase-like lactoylglutathione lyase family enzyme